MDWLRKYDGVIQCREKSVHLTSPQGDRIEFIATSSPTGKELVNSMKGKMLEDIKVVNEYPDVFPDDLTYKEHPVKILDTSERATRSKVIRMCKVQWGHHSEDEATWEREDKLKEEFPQLFSNLPESLDEILFKGVGFVTP
jgi:hypothetical protein